MRRVWSAMMLIGVGAWGESDECGPDFGSLSGKPMGEKIAMGILMSTSQLSSESSQTSGCEEHTVHIDHRTLRFVHAHRAQLAREIAMGQGESVETLAELLDVSDRHAFALALQTHYHTLYPSSKISSKELIVSIVRSMQG